MKGSKWLILVVIIMAVAAVVAKQNRRAPVPPEPIAPAPAPSQSAPHRDSSVSTHKDELEAPEQEQPAGPAAPEGPTQVNPRPAPHPLQGKPKPAPPAEEPQTTASATPEQPAANQQPTRQPQAEPAPEPAPKPEGPLPGSKLKDCLSNGLPTMADFGLGTCKPCKAMEPILKQAAQDYWGRANILFVELDKYGNLAREYRIRVMPTQIFFDASGQQVDSHMGYMDRAEIDRRLAALGVKQ